MEECQLIFWTYLEKDKWNAHSRSQINAGNYLEVAFINYTFKKWGWGRQNVDQNVTYQQLGIITKNPLRNDKNCEDRRIYRQKNFKWEILQVHDKEVEYLLNHIMEYLNLNVWWCLGSKDKTTLFANHYLCIFILLLCRTIAFIKDMLQRFKIQLWHLVPALESSNGIFQRYT